MAKDLKNPNPALKLYRADEETAILRRQNNRYTHTFNIPIKSVGTTLLLIRATNELTNDELKSRIIKGNTINDNSLYPFDLTYFQIVASCRMRDTIINNKDGYKYDGTLTLNYRTAITAPSGASVPPTELFVANSLLARATRQTSRGYDTIKSEVIGTTEDGYGDYFYLVLVAAKENGDNGTEKGYYIFDLSEDEPETHDPETLRSFFNTDTAVVEENDGAPENKDAYVTFVRILGYFPGDQPDFERFIDEEYTITVSGNGNLTITIQVAEPETETEENNEG